MAGQGFELWGRDCYYPPTGSRTVAAAAAFQSHESAQMEAALAVHTHSSLVHVRNIWRAIPYDKNPIVYWNNSIIHLITEGIQSRTHKPNDTWQT